MKQNSERSKSSPGAQSHSGGRSPLARQAAARVLQAAANRRAFNAQIRAQQTPAASAAQELGITPTVTTADALDGGIDFTGNAADPGTTLQGRDVARTAIRGLSGTPYTVDQMVQQYEAYTAPTAGSGATMAKSSAAAVQAAAGLPTTTTVAHTTEFTIFLKKKKSTVSVTVACSCYSPVHELLAATHIERILGA